MGAGERATIQDQAPADSGPHPEAEHVADADGCGCDPLAEQTDVGVVAERDGHVDPLSPLIDEIDLLGPVLQIGNGQHPALVDHSGYAHSNSNRSVRQRFDQCRNGVQDFCWTTRRGVCLRPTVHLVVSQDQTDLDVGASHVDSGNQQVRTHLSSAII